MRFLDNLRLKTLSLAVAVLCVACGDAPEPYAVGINAQPQANGEATTKGVSPASSTSGTNSKNTTAAPAKTTETKNNAPGTPPATPVVNPPPANNAVNPPANTAALVQQGTTIYNMKCAGCHGALAARANDPRIYRKTAAQITAAKTVKAAAHAATVWPLAAEIPALEAAFK